jgi:hypothetical protein
MEASGESFLSKAIASFDHCALCLGPNVKFSAICRANLWNLRQRFIGLHRGVLKMAATSRVQCKISAPACLGAIQEIAVVPMHQPPSLKLPGGVCLKPVAEYRYHLRHAHGRLAINKRLPSGRLARLPDQNAQIPEPPVRGF